MTTTYQVCTVANHIDERMAFWTVLEVPEHSETGEPVPAILVGTGRTEDEAIADFKRRAGLDDGLVMVEITHRDNVNIEIHVGGDAA